MSKRRQAQNSTISKFPGFWERLCDAIGTVKTGEIAVLLRVSPSLVSDWKAERASPTLSVLFDIAERFGTEIDWLLTGRAPRTMAMSVDGTHLRPLPSDTRRTIKQIAHETGLPPEDVIGQLVHDGLMFRGEPFVWHEDEKIRKGETKVIMSVMNWLKELSESERSRFAKRLSFLVLNAATNSQAEQDHGVGSMQPAEMILAPSIGRVGDDDAEEVVRKAK